MTRCPAPAPPAHETAAIALRDRPVHFHGPSREYVHPHRRVMQVPDHTWPAEHPETCTWDSPSGRWFDRHGRPVDPDTSDHDAGVFLLCPGCGLDAT
ncbi:hypothetical protein J2S66_001987 [Saccharothrix longispora]|uniref:Uncharacterized protein n=1 Tax=Saccharothrix longispora TaxID=33920 RepID=A0ABU1PSH9_9PSEU|nr:hypothetical protein [Saccharothrix longispora]